MNFLFKMEPPDAGSELFDKYFDLRSKGKFSHFLKPIILEF